MILSPIPRAQEQRSTSLLGLIAAVARHSVGCAQRIRCHLSPSSTKHAWSIDEKKGLQPPVDCGGVKEGTVVSGSDLATGGESGRVRRVANILVSGQAFVVPEPVRRAD